MSDQIVNINNTYHVNGDGVQIGNGQNALHINNQLREEVGELREEVDELKERVRQLQAKLQTNTDSNTEEPEYQMGDDEEEDGDMITLDIRCIGYSKMAISVSRDKTVSDLEALIQEEWRRKYGIDGVCCITGIYSVKQEEIIYNYKINNRDRLLSHYGIGNGDTVYWW